MGKLYLPIVWICYGKGRSLLEISCVRLRGGWPPDGKMLENRPKDALGSLVKTVETVETERRLLKYLTL